MAWKELKEKKIELLFKNLLIYFIYVSVVAPGILSLMCMPVTSVQCSSSDFRAPVTPEDLFPAGHSSSVDCKRQEVFDGVIQRQVCR